ncbi:hypothetical protein MJA45_22545 [Paenibacillus aurantius]|uniref:CBM-cenC domain-containing protein n=1 Tax=Paenibacillus aurantius TaxID=2918900 RepID=A0AA96LAT9_9BACL|nr:carbohydrate binding domain-containing protein [Paenibacillus aurantius]WNQ10374.1 hypothetical protein MJA45_22545 [Paenibacillus aurantius]
MKGRRGSWKSVLRSASLAAVLLAGALPMNAGLPAAKAAALDSLVNGGFEADGANGQAAGWIPEGGASSVTVSTSVYAEGKRSLRVEDPSPAVSYGAVSDAVAVTPFVNVELTAKVKSESGEGGKADLRFYNGEGKLVSVVSGLVPGGTGEWTDLRVAASAPKDGARVTVSFYYPNEKTGVYYADAASLKVGKEQSYITNLGPQSTSLTLMTGAYGTDKDGRASMYTVIQGDPAQFVVSDVVTKEVKAQHPLVALDGSPVTAAWAITTASDGKVYIGSTPNGTLFQYDPVKDTMRTIGKPVPTDTVIWVLVPGENGKVYGGTGYSQTLFEYDPATDKSRILTSFKSSSKESHLRSLAYDPDHKVLYAGGADVAKLYRYDLATGKKTALTPPEFAGKTSVYDLQFTAGKLFVRVDPGPVMFVYDPAANSWIVKNNAQYNTRGFSPVSPDGRVFYTYYETLPDGRQQWSLHAYNTATDTYSSLGLDVKGAGVAFGYVKLNTPDYPGVTLVGLAGNGGRAFYYNLETGKLETPELPLPPQFVELFNIAKSVDGQMLSSGFISGGGMGIYSPTKDETKLYPSIGQVEGFGSLNGKMYLGVYPRATIFEYDPKEPWNRTDPSAPQNPLRLGQLGDEQDRPVSMVGVEELNKLFIASYPIAGKIGGALSVYDPVTKTFDVKRNLVPDHSINSLVYRDGLLYMGTGAMNGGEGKLVTYDPSTGQILSERVPVSGKKAVTSLFWGPDGNLWGMALGALFVYDPAADRIIYSEDLFPTADYSHSNPRLMTGTDGNVYGTIYTGYVADKTYTSKMIKIDAVTKEMTVLLESNAEKLAQDDFGNFYFKYGSELMKYSDPSLVVGLEKVTLSTDAPSLLHPGDEAKVSFDVLLQKGRTTNELSGAKIEYVSSRPKSAEVTPDGKVIAKHPGRTEIFVRVTLNGVTVESAPVAFLVTGPF